MLHSLPYLEAIVVGANVAVGLMVLGGLLVARARLAELDRSGRRLSVALGLMLMGWFVTVSWLSATGGFRAAPDGPMPPPIIYAILLPVIVGVVFISVSRAFGRLLDTIPQHWLVGVQLYRAFGVIFLIVHAAGHLPGIFALPAGYGDIAVGLAAPAVAYLIVRGAPAASKLVLGWNILGIADLAMAVSLGFLSAPGPFQMLSLDAPNQAISAFPMVMVPVFAVPLSLLLHACSIKKLLRQTDGIALDASGHARP